MNKMRILMLVCFAIIVILFVRAHAAEAVSLTAPNGGGLPANNPWTVQTVESISGVDVGQYASITYNLATGKPYISHYDATNHDLRLAYPHDTIGNCSVNDSWYCMILDSPGDVGKYSSIDYYYPSTASLRKMGVAYYDASNYALKVAIWSCPTIISCSWKYSTVQKGFGSLASYGLYASLKFASDGTAHIAYYNSNAFGDDTLQYAHSVSSGGNCGEDAAAGQWQCVQVDSGPSVGLYASLDLTSDNRPVIAYYVPSPGELKLCTLNGTWTCRTIDTVGSAFPSLAIDQSNHTHIAYYNSVTGALRYAKYVGAGGNCGQNSSTSQYEYRCDAIENVGSAQNWGSFSLVMDTANLPMIAYQNATDPQGYPMLKVARPINAYGLIAGNCGPQVGYLYQWQCNTIDGAAGYLYEADYVSAMIDPTGLAYVAYSEYDDYYSQYRLKVAYQQRLQEIYLPLAIK